MPTDLIKVFAPSTLSFLIGIILAPFVANFLYQHRLWKKKAGKISPDGSATPIFDKLHAHKETGTPRMGGVIIWLSVLATVGLVWLSSALVPANQLLSKLNFLSRNQTWLPLFTLIAGSLVGLLDDLLQVSQKADAHAGLSFRKRTLVVLAIGLLGGLWFYWRLGVETVHLPLYGPLFFGWLIVPFFMLVMFSLFSSSVIDGLDGLAGGVLSTIFAAYAGIAYFQNRIDLAAFCAVVLGGLLAFLWFNIPPARFYMSETGILGLTTTLTVVAFLTDTVLLVPIIAFPLFITAVSVVIQLTAKKFFHRKVFLVAPLHHHFEAIGWPASKVVMRYWIIGVVTALIGMIIALLP